jgi:hypothetical protein
MQRDDELEEDFPGLRGGGYSITSPIDVAYNCVAWAVGDTKYFWDDVGVSGYYWPPGVAADALSGWVEVFRIHGYSYARDPGFDEEFEKIAIYAVGSDPRHVARQKASGLWTSKMGKGHDIEHALDLIEGDLYGMVSVIMERPCKGKRVHE